MPLTAGVSSNTALNALRVPQMERTISTAALPKVGTPV